MKILPPDANRCRCVFACACVRKRAVKASQFLGIVSTCRWRAALALNLTEIEDEKVEVEPRNFVGSSSRASKTYFALPQNLILELNW